MKQSHVFARLLDDAGHHDRVRRRPIRAPLPAALRSKRHGVAWASPVQEKPSATLPRRGQTPRH
jgi:hypothetical protein